MGKDSIPGDCGGRATGTMTNMEGRHSPLSLPGDSNSAPPWLGREPLIQAVNYVPEIFVNRVGWSANWLLADWKHAEGEEAVRQLKHLGVSMVSIALFTGFGLEAEKEAIDDSGRFSALLRRHGIRVGVYVGSTIMYETILAEIPEAKEWFVPDYLGRPVRYWGWKQNEQSFRKRVYFMHPGYREYMKRVLRVGIEDLHAEVIHYDNTSQMADPMIFQHPLAVEDFRTFLRNRYPPDKLKERLGFSDVRYVEPPEDDTPLSAIDDPLWQEWADFRCYQLAQYYAELKVFIRSLNPNVAMAVNARRGISGYNTIWQGVDYPTLAPQVDIFFNEEGVGEGNPRQYAGTTADGLMVSKIRSYKMATILNKRVLTRTAVANPAKGGESVFEFPGGRVQMAESMAYNRQCLGNVGEGFFTPYLPDQERDYVRFFLEHFDLYQGVDTVADAALLYSHATMGFNNDRPAVSFMLYAQALIQGKVPFDLIFDQHLKDLSKYRVLVLADQECLSDQQLELIRQFVRGGGGLVATEHTSLYTEWRRRRPEFGLKDLWEVTAPVWRGVCGQGPAGGCPESVLNIAPARQSVGNGRVVYLPEVKPAIEKPAAVPMTSMYWKLPDNWEILLDSVRWAAGGRLTLEVDAPLTVTAELLEQPKTGKLLLHLINYDLDRTPRVENLRVAIRRAGMVKEVTLLSPDGAQEKVTPTTKDEELAFTISALNCYSVAVMS